MKDKTVLVIGFLSHLFGVSVCCDCEAGLWIVFRQKMGEFYAVRTDVDFLLRFFKHESFLTDVINPDAEIYSVSVGEDKFFCIGDEIPDKSVVDFGRIEKIREFDEMEDDPEFAPDDVFIELFCQRILDDRKKVAEDIKSLLYVSQQ